MVAAINCGAGLTRVTCGVGAIVLPLGVASVRCVELTGERCQCGASGVTATLQAVQYSSARCQSSSSESLSSTQSETPTACSGGSHRKRATAGCDGVRDTRSERRERECVRAHTHTHTQRRACACAAKRMVHVHVELAVVTQPEGELRAARGESTQGRQVRPPRGLPHMQMEL